MKYEGFSAKLFNWIKEQIRRRWKKNTRAKTGRPAQQVKKQKGNAGVWPHPWASAHNGEEKGALGLAAGNDPRGHEEAGPISLNRDEHGSGSSS